MTSFAQASEVIEARPTPTTEQHAAAQRYVTEHAPDLIAVIFGDQPADYKEN